MPALRRLATPMLVAAFALTACGGTAARPAAPQPSGDPARGKVVFTTVAPERPACSTYHTIQGVAEGGIGPDLTRIGTDAAARVTAPGYRGAGKDAAGYIRESIIDPNAYIAPTCPATGSCVKDIMPKDFATKLRAQELSDLIAYLLSLK